MFINNVNIYYLACILLCADCFALIYEINQNCEVIMVEALRKKSPRAPSMSLDEALARVMKVYDRERLHPAPTEVVAQHLGYKNANSGSAMSALASLRYFGLLDRPKEGLLSVARQVESYKFAPDEKLKRSLLLSFLKKPPLYNDLLEKYESGLPSDPNLKFELIQRGFVPQAAEPALAVFKASVAFADYFGGEFGNAVEEDAEVDSQDSFLAAIDSSSAEDKGAIASSSASRHEELDDPQVDRIPVRLPGGRRAWLLIPTPFYEADKARLKAQIDLLLTSEEDNSPL